MANFAWTCPYCGHVQTVTEHKYNSDIAHVSVTSKKYPALAVRAMAIGCANADCDEVQIVTQIGRYGPPKHGGAGQSGFHDVISTNRLRPESSSKPQPNYIPEAILSDYGEACRIRDLSPKASATLSRRCLQGMIRDFCKINKIRLVDEIATLRSAVNDGIAPQGVSEDSIEAIDNLRKVGNIGAHMEKDIDVIVDVDPNEAQALIELIESLFEEWYVARDKRQRRFARVAEVASQKAIEKKVIGSESQTLSNLP